MSQVTEKSQSQKKIAANFRRSPDCTKLKIGAMKKIDGVKRLASTRTW
jgi:hypothetical protein